MIHVGLNLVFLVPGETGGMEVYARELIAALAARDDVRVTAFVNREAAEAGLDPWPGAAETVVVPVHARSRVAWVRGEQQHLPPLAVRAGVDVLHSLASTGPAWGATPRVVTIHDLIYRLHPETHAGLRAWGMRVLVPLAAHRSRRVIVLARSTREDVCRHLRVRPAKVDVVPSGVGALARVAPVPEAELRARLGVPGGRPIVLSVSAKRPHKNLGRLIGALACIPAERRPVLVLPGYPTPFEDELRARAAALGVAGDVRFLGWIDDATLEGLYAAAACMAFPSLYEGFGLPVLEAMARGVPVACSHRGSLGEVAGDAALLFDPESEASIAETVERLLGDPALAEGLRARGRAQAARFTWDAAAAGTVASYARALSGGGETRRD
jgi:glycosyltransferase involved in cell wall biosynthesis